MAAPIVSKRTNLIARAKRNKLRDQQDIREVITFLRLDLGCFHARLEYAQCDPTLQHQFPFPPPCGDACYFCNKQHKQWFHAVSVNKYNVEGLFLQLLATGILNSAVGTDAFPDETSENEVSNIVKTPDSLYVWIAFDTTTGNPCYNLEHLWHGINMIV
eukprot:scaffold59297_cov60-Attheya_sp.AAC.1